MIAIDTETHLIAPEGKVRSLHDVPDLVCITWAKEDGSSGLIMWDEPGAGPKLKSLLDGETVVMHNAKFDLAVLSKWDRYFDAYLKAMVDAGRILDTRVLYANRYPLKDRLRSLAAIVRHLFRKGLDKGGVRVSFRRGQTLTPAQRDYAIDDAVWTLAVARRLLELGPGDLARQEQEFVVAAQPLYGGQDPVVLYSRAASYLAWFLEPEGQRVNLDTVDREFRKLEADETRLCLRLYGAGLMRPERLPGTPERIDAPATSKQWEIRSPDPLRLQRIAGSKKNGYHVEQIPGKWVLNTPELQGAFEAAAEALGLDVERTATGKISMEYDFWKEFATDLPEELQDYLKLSKVRKYKSSFVGPLATQRPERVYPHYSIPGAETGRWACYRPNLTQQPKRLRPMYGGQTLGADYKSLECFTLAHAMAALGIRGPMLEALGKEDLHIFVAARCGVERQEAKVATFGLGGGMGFKRFYRYMRFQCGLDVTYAQACDVRTRWLQFFTDVQQYLDLFRRNYYELCPTWCSKRTWLNDLGFDTDQQWPSSFELSRRLGGKITCVLPSGRVIPQRNFSQAANIFFQGTGADVMTAAFVKLCEDRVRTCAVVHDSAYSPDLECGHLLTENMHKALVEVCPTVADVAPKPQAEIQPTFF